MTTKHRFYFVMAAVLVSSAVFANTVHAAINFEVLPVSETGKISINKSSARTLQLIRGMNAYKAHAIVAYRNKNGAFKSVSELDKVKGFKRITPKAMKAITDHLQVD